MKKSFTLIELLVIVYIILSALSSPFELKKVVKAAKSIFMPELVCIFFIHTV